jgi:hypothetical protein
MRWSLPLAFSFLALLLAAALADAQEGTLLPSRPFAVSAPSEQLTGDERATLDAWLDAMRKWRKADKRSPNGPAHDPFGRVIERAVRPDPPAWLDARCNMFAPEVAQHLPNPLGAACRVMAGLDADPAADAIRASTTAARAGAEKLIKDSFLTRVHLDGLWTTTSTDYRMYGLVGSHISLVDVGRVQFFGPPGLLLLSVPDGRGGREIRTGYTWGLSVRLADVRLMSPTKNMTLFLSITKVWVIGPSIGPVPGGAFDIAGFSLAPRKHTQ